jgi:hypothetical protein
MERGEGIGAASMMRNRHGCRCGAATDQRLVSSSGSKGQCVLVLLPSINKGRTPENVSSDETLERMTDKRRLGSENILDDQFWRKVYVDMKLTAGSHTARCWCHYRDEATGFSPSCFNTSGLTTVH